MKNSSLQYQQFKLLLAWTLLKMRSPRGWKVAKPAKRVLIVPADPWSLNGSRGDEAMIQAVVDNFSDVSPASVHFATAVGNERAAKAAVELKLEPLLCWQGFRSAMRAILNFKPDAVVIIGADCMDGYYHPMTSSRFIATADLLARLRVPVVFTGFSFNDQPNSFVLKLFDKLSPDVQVNLRDPVSLARFQKFSRHSAHLVADAAFMLRPADGSSKVAAVREWIANQQARGTKVVAFNVHPHLLKDRSPESHQRLIGSASAALSRVLADTDISLLLLAHDYRERDADDHCLGGIHRNLQAGGLDARILYPTGPFSAAELKALVQDLDGVITGRMHLAIASLGMGVPISAIAYQGKFSGLLKHFNYPEDMQISAADALDEQLLYAFVMRFLNSMRGLKAATALALPAVKQLSRNNFRSILQDKGHA